MYLATSREGAFVRSTTIRPSSALPNVGSTLKPMSRALQSDVLPEQDGDPAAVGVDRGDQLVGIGDVTDGAAGEAGLAFTEPCEAGRCRGFREIGKLTAAKCGRQEADQKFPGQGRVRIRNARGAEESPVSGIVGDEPADALPEQEQRGVIALRLQADERAPQLDAGYQQPHLRGLVSKKRRGIQTIGPAVATEFVR